LALGCRPGDLINRGPDEEDEFSMFSDLDERSKHKVVEYIRGLMAAARSEGA
jgi:hypothetical protein